MGCAERPRPWGGGGTDPLADSVVGAGARLPTPACPPPSFYCRGALSSGEQGGRRALHQAVDGLSCRDNSAWGVHTPPRPTQVRGQEGGRQKRPGFYIVPHSSTLIVSRRLKLDHEACASSNQPLMGSGWGRDTAPALQPRFQGSALHHVRVHPSLIPLPLPLCRPPPTPRCATTPTMSS